MPSNYIPIPLLYGKKTKEAHKMENMEEKIHQEIQENPIILYMKGSKHLPLCGFSARVVEILNTFNVEYVTRDVLEDDALRIAIKAYSNWPTLPQLYVNGKFIGGCDIITTLYENGDFEKILS